MSFLSIGDFLTPEQPAKEYARRRSQQKCQESSDDEDVNKKDACTPE